MAKYPDKNAAFIPEVRPHEWIEGVNVFSRKDFKRVEYVQLTEKTMHPKRERRYKNLFVDTETVLTMLGQWKFGSFLALPKFDGLLLPDDAAVVAIHADDFNERFAITIQSAAFADVPAGQEIPPYLPPFDVNFEQVSLEAIPGLAVRKLSPKEGDVIVIRYPVGNAGHKSAAIRAATELGVVFPKCVFVVAEDGMSLETTDLETMRQAGWVRADPFLIPQRGTFNRYLDKPPQECDKHLAKQQSFDRKRLKDAADAQAFAMASSEARPWKCPCCEQFVPIRTMSTFGGKDVCRDCYDNLKSEHERVNNPLSEAACMRKALEKAARCVNASIDAYTKAQADSDGLDKDASSAWIDADIERHIVSATPKRSSEQLALERQRQRLAADIERQIVGRFTPESESYVHPASKEAFAIAQQIAARQQIANQIASEMGLEFAPRVIDDEKPGETEGDAMMDFFKQRNSEAPQADEPCTTTTKPEAPASS